MKGGVRMVLLSVLSVSDVTGVEIGPLFIPCTRYVMRPLMKL